MDAAGNTPNPHPLAVATTSLPPALEEVQSERPPGYRAAALIWLVLTGAALGACWGVFSALDRIDNNPENFTLYRGRLWVLAVVCHAVALGACAVCWSLPSIAIRRAARFAVIIIAVMFVLWYAPLVFGVHRYLLALLGLVAAARLALAPLLAMREPHAPLVRWWWMLIVMTSALALAAGVMISLKQHFLGWAFAID